MNWESLEDELSFNNLLELSYLKPCLIFKYSTRCASSPVVKDRLERSWDLNEMKGVRLFYLDLIAHRELSDLVAHRLKVRHESPQVILLHKGEVIYHASHFMISYDHLNEVIQDPAVKSEN